MSKYCPKCGTEVTADAKFCPNCGFTLQNAADDTGKEPDAKDTVDQPSSAATTDSTIASGDQPAAASKNQTQSVADKQGDAEPQKKTNRTRWTKWIVAAIVIMILVVFGYRQFYVPHTVESALDSNGFTSSKGYVASANVGKHKVTIYPNSTSQQKIAQELAQNEYDTRRITVENNLSDLAHDLSGKTFGTWKIEIALKDNQGTVPMWKYSGTKETHRFQTSSAGRQLREEYLQRKEQAAQQAQQEDEDEKIGAGLLGGGIGFLLGGL